MTMATTSDNTTQRTRPACPRCRKQTGLRLDHPPGPYNDVFRCDGRLQGCGYLWSPTTAG